MTMGDRIAVLEFGVLQQVDTPQNLYNRPANLFVAGFIGSPAMNLFDGRLTHSDGAIRFQMGDVTLTLSNQHEQALAGHVGAEAVLGIRPEHILDRRLVADEAAANVVQTRIDVVEPLGNETFLYLTPLRIAGQATFIARMSPDTDAQSGQEFGAVFDMTRAHVFEKASGRTIT